MPSTSFNAAGLLLTAAGILMALALVAHPAPGANAAENAQIIANTPNWALIHLAIVIAAFFFAAAAIVIANEARAGSLNPGLWALAAVAFIAFGSVIMVEVTTVPSLIDAVSKGAATETAIFNAFNAFVEGIATLGATIFLLSFAAIALIEHRSKQVVSQPWLSLLAGVLALAGALGILGPTFGYAVFAPLFFANIFVAIYFAYFGWNLRRKK